MTLVMPVRAAPVAGPRWRRHILPLVVVWIALLALFARDAARTVTTWWTSTTFEHCFVVLPVIGWLVWQRRALLAQLTPVAWWPGLALVVAGGVTWLVGEAGAVTFAREFGLLLLLQAAVVTLLGPQVTRGIAFPLGYAFFLVPFGEWLEGPLQLVTVRLAMPMLALLGLPATSNGVVIHAGRYWFEVAEACSGAKFVIAMVAVGVLVANLCFRRWERRAAFLAACVIVPVLANGLRAVATMWVANRTSVETAAGFDHIVYGWVWFGVVMAVTLAIGWRWFDKPVDAPAFDPAALAGPVGRTLLPIPAAAFIVAIAALFLAWGSVASARTTPLPARLALPDLPGWTRVPLSASAPWQPYYPQADRTLIARYADAAGNRVDVAVAVDAGQSEGHGLVAYGTGGVGEGGWLRVADLRPIAGASAMQIAAPGTGNGPVDRIVTTRYLVADTATTRPAVVKLATLRAHLLGGSQIAMAIHLSAEVEPGREPAAAIARLAAVLPTEPLVEVR